MSWAGNSERVEANEGGRPRRRRAQPTAYWLGAASSPAACDRGAFPSMAASKPASSASVINEMWSSLSSASELVRYSCGLVRLGAVEGPHADATIRDRGAFPSMAASKADPSASLQSNLNNRYGLGSHKFVLVIETYRKHRACWMCRHVLGAENRTCCRDVLVMKRTGFRNSPVLT